jgi:hypothetical protein
MLPPSSGWWVTDGGSTYLWNVGQQLICTAVHPRRQIWTSYSPPWELEISQCVYLLANSVCICNSQRYSQIFCDYFSNRKHKVWFWMLQDDTTTELGCARVTSYRYSKDFLCLLQSAQADDGIVPPKRLSFYKHTQHCLSHIPCIWGHIASVLLARNHVDACSSLQIKTHTCAVTTPRSLHAAPLASLDPISKLILWLTDENNVNGEATVLPWRHTRSTMMD